MSKLFKTSIPVLLLSSPFIAFAQVHTAPRIALDINVVLGFVSRFVDWIYSIILILAVIVLLIGAFTLLTAGGDESKIASGKNWILWAVVGLAVAILARGIVLFVCSFFGVACG